ncbi:MAG: GGDEF domain-containing protein [Faecalibacterium sp.]
MEKIRNFLLYAGADPDMFQKCLPEIHRENRLRLKLFLIAAVCALLVMMILSIQVGVLESNTLIYSLGLIICLAILYVDMCWPNQPLWVTNMLIRVFLSELYLIGIYLGTVATTADREAVTHVAFLLMLPTLFIHSPLSQIIMTLVFNVIFSIAAIQYKVENVMMLDLINSWVFCIISILLSSYIMHNMVESFVNREKIRSIAETDLNTNLKSRNAYEHRQDFYLHHCSINLSCVYVDVNGLHELNNTQGHQEGDRMLQAVAQLFRDEFGPENSYRMGGDEYLAFVIDTPEQEVRQKAEHFFRAVQDAGYSVAIGSATQSVGGIEIEDLVKLAEQRMYSVKEEHYRQMNRTTR